MFSVIKKSVNWDALYLVKLIFGKYFLFFRIKSRCRFIAIAIVLGHKSYSDA